MIENKWINTEKIICDDAVKPCHFFPACPYGTLVELFPLEHGMYSCEVFGHDCPIFYHIEGFIEFSAMVEREDGIVPEANGISPINFYKKEKYWEKFFNGLVKFIQTKIELERNNQNIKELKEILFLGFEKLVKKINSL